MNCLNYSTAQTLTERERKIKDIYDAKIEQIIDNCISTSIIKDGINSDLRDSITVVKTNLSVTNKTLTVSKNKANKYQTMFFISVVLIIGMGFIVFKLLTKGRFI